MLRVLKTIGLCVVGLVVSSAASAGDYDRNLAGKLTSFKKPEVRVLTDHERSIAQKSLLALDLDFDPNEIVCKKVRAGRDSASRLVVNRCKTRAEFRQEFEDRVSQSQAAYYSAMFNEHVRNQMRKAYSQRIPRTVKP